jgi:hypothetical protein
LVYRYRQYNSNDIRVGSGRVFCVRLQRWVERSPAAARYWSFNQGFGGIKKKIWRRFIGFLMAHFQNRYLNILLCLKNSVNWLNYDPKPALLPEQAQSIPDEKNRPFFTFS